MNAVEIEEAVSELANQPFDAAALKACQLDIPPAKLTNKDAIRSFCGRAKRAFSQKLAIDFG